MPRLIFKSDELKRVIDHTLSSSPHAAELIGYDDGRPITTPGKPGVILVHDHGVYLMSNGEPHDLVKDETSYVVYAEGCDPKHDAEWWETSRDLVGGDDFGETLPWVTEIQQLISNGEQKIEIEVAAGQLMLVSFE
jgi:hypothetical protein